MVARFEGFFITNIETSRLFRSRGEVGRWGTRMAEVLEETVRAEAPERTGTLVASIEGSSVGNEGSGRSHVVDVDIAFASHGIFSLGGTDGVQGFRDVNGRASIPVGRTGGYLPVSFASEVQGQIANDWLSDGIHIASLRFPSIAGWSPLNYDIGFNVDVDREGYLD